MGLFFKRKKEKNIIEILDENHTTAWYEENAGKTFLKMFFELNTEGISGAINLYCLKYFESFENIVENRKKGMEIDTVILGKKLACYIEKEIADREDLPEKAARATFGRIVLTLPTV